MKLDRVTITGADDSIKPSSLAVLSARYPFVEWGILESATQTGHPRFPTLAWLEELWRVRQDNPRMQLSLHLCGRWLRGLLQGAKPPMRPQLLDMFQRVQLNFHAENQTIGKGFEEALAALGAEEIIFQIDGNMGQEIIAHVEGNGPQSFRCVPLFDLSHGAGTVPNDWPKPFDADTYHGYAGGLGPDNLQHQIPLIAKAAGDARFWIDMETKVRSAADRNFDLAKVERCLQIAMRFIDLRHSDVVADCARMREEARREFTIADAIAEAEWLAKTPDGVLSHAVAKQTVLALLAALQSSPCYYKAVQRGIPTFTFLAYDKAGHDAIRLWSVLAEKHGARPEKYVTARTMVAAWEQRTDLRWPT